MSLGVLNNLSAVYAENALNNTNNSLSKTLQQLSTGSRINSGADDAAGLSLVNGLQANQTALTQSETNASEGAGLLQVADGALSQVTSLLNRAVTLATEVSNGTLNGSQDAAANQEYQSILSEINDIGTTTTYNQNQVFGGPDVAVYTGDSSTTGASIDSLHFASLSSSSVGDAGGQVQQSNAGFFLDLSTDTAGKALTSAATETDTITGGVKFTITNSDGTDSTGSRLSLVSNTSGAAGKMTIASALTDSALVSKTNTTGAIKYNSTSDGKDASLEIDGVPLTSASNTVSNLIPGVTFQLLAPGAQESDGTVEPVQVVISNDNSGVESAVNQFVTDYNSLMSAINAQEGNDSSGNPEPLFGTPTLSLLQQELLGGINTQSPNGYLDAIKNPGDTLSGSISISMAGGIPLSFSGTAGTDANSTKGIDATTSTGTLSAIENAGDTVSGSITIQVGSGTAETVKVGDSSTPDTLAGLASAINAAKIGVTASVITNSDSSSSLSLLSGTTGSAGTLTVTSSIADTSTQTIDVPTSQGNDNLAGLASAINASHSGVTASVVTNGLGSQLVFVSNTSSAGGGLTVTPSITDAKTNTALNYNNSNSDINSLTTLGISVNNDGSLALDANALDSLLSSDYTSVVGFFQNVNGWGQTFSTMLTNAGSSSSTGILALAAKSNSNTESSLNAEVAKEDALIATQKTQLTNELNQANEILQELPSQLSGMNELYSAITGYNENSNG
jgi:flagellin-like hook-associated protein FlgL